jgi:Leucine-rich repeat (LRR) protein
MATGVRRKKTPDEVYAEAVEQIETVRRRHSPSLMLGKGRRSLLKLPPLENLPDLKALNLLKSSVTDLSPLKGVPHLKSLSLSDTTVSDLYPVADLSALETLDLTDTPVTDLAPISGLLALQELMLGNSAITNLEPLRNLKNLRYLSLHHTKVSDLSPIENLQNLATLWIDDSPITDLSPIRNLVRLERLLLGEMNASDFSFLLKLRRLHTLQLAEFGHHPIDLSYVSESVVELILPRSRLSSIDSLSRLKRLELLSLYGTNIEDLTPLRNAIRLKTLTVRRTAVSDLTPLSHLTHLEDLGIDDTLVSDLSPIAGINSLTNGAARQYAGISFRRCPISDPVLRELANKRNPERTIAVLTYLNAKQGVPSSKLKMTEPSFNWVEIVERVEQDPLGVRFEPSEEHFEIADSGNISDQEATADSTIRQLHEQVRVKSSELASRAERLANRPDWQALTGASGRFNELVKGDIESIAQQIGLVWGELVSLGSFLEQDDTLRKVPEIFASPLDADIRRPLADLLQTAGPWLRRFPTARQLDSEHATFKAPRESVDPARDIIDFASAEALIQENDADILDAALRAGERKTIQSVKAGSWGVFFCKKSNYWSNWNCRRRSDDRCF